MPEVYDVTETYNYDLWAHYPLKFLKSPRVAAVTKATAEAGKQEPSQIARSCRRNLLPLLLRRSTIDGPLHQMPHFMWATRRR